MVTTASCSQALQDYGGFFEIMKLCIKWDDTKRIASSGTRKESIWTWPITHFQVGLCFWIEHPLQKYHSVLSVIYFLLCFVWDLSSCIQPAVSCNKFVFLLCPGFLSWFVVMTQNSDKKTVGYLQATKASQGQAVGGGNQNKGMEEVEAWGPARSWNHGRRPGISSKCQRHIQALWTTSSKQQIQIQVLQVRHQGTMVCLPLRDTHLL